MYTFQPIVGGMIILIGYVVGLMTAGLLHRHKSCSHEQLDPVTADGYQHCSSCGKAFAAPASPTHCYHDLKNKRRFTVVILGRQQVFITQQCRACGRLFTYNRTEGRYEGLQPSQGERT